MGVCQLGQVYIHVNLFISTNYGVNSEICAVQLFRPQEKAHSTETTLFQCKSFYLRKLLKDN